MAFNAASLRDEDIIPHIDVQLNTALGGRLLTISTPRGAGAMRAAGYSPFADR